MLNKLEQSLKTISGAKEGYILGDREGYKFVARYLDTEKNVIRHYEYECLTKGGTGYSLERLVDNNTSVVINESVSDCDTLDDFLEFIQWHINA